MWVASFLNQLNEMYRILLLTFICQYSLSGFSQIKVNARKRGKVDVEASVNIDTPVQRQQLSNQQNVTESGKVAESVPVIVYQSLVSNISLDPKGSLKLDEIVLKNTPENDQNGQRVKYKGTRNPDLMLKVQLYNDSKQQIGKDCYYSISRFETEEQTAVPYDASEFPVKNEGIYQLHFEFLGNDLGSFEVDVAQLSQQDGLTFYTIESPWENNGWVSWRKNEKDDLLIFQTLLPNRTKDIKNTEMPAELRRPEYLISLQRQVENDTTFTTIAYNKLSAAKNEPLYRSVSIKRGSFKLLETTFIDYPRVLDLENRTFEITRLQDITAGSYRIQMEYYFDPKQKMTKFFRFQVDEKGYIAKTPDVESDIVFVHADGSFLLQAE